MTVAQDREINQETWENIIIPPRDLWSDEPPLESDRHRQQIDTLINCINFWWRDRQDFYASGNITIYYSPEQTKSRDFRGPDFFLVLGTERKDRKSWVVWVNVGWALPTNVIISFSTSKWECPPYGYCY